MVSVVAKKVVSVLTVQMVEPMTKISVVLLAEFKHSVVTIIVAIISQVLVVFHQNDGIQLPMLAQVLVWNVPILRLLLSFRQGLINHILLVMEMEILRRLTSDTNSQKLVHLIHLLFLKLHSIKHLFSIQHFSSENIELNVFTEIQLSLILDLLSLQIRVPKISPSKAQVIRLLKDVVASMRIDE